MIFETNSSGEISNFYEYGLDLVKNRTSETYYNYNAHGDVVQLTDSEGEVTADYTYDAFGNTQLLITDSNPFRYCGEYTDSETGNIYLRNRYYNPSTGRFINEDPIRDGLNWYSYCGGNPISFIDPSGCIEIYTDTSETDEEKSARLIEEEKMMNTVKGKNRPITVIEDDSSINIYAYVAISGELANEIVKGTDEGEITYRQATINGIVDSWSGKFEDKIVSVFVIDLNDGKEHIKQNGQKVISINLVNSYGEARTEGIISRSNPGHIKVFKGDENADYTYDDFKKTIGHEFGHTLGIDDLYNDSTVKYVFPSFMNNEYELDGVQAVDYAMMLRAQSIGGYQAWGENNDLIKKYVPNEDMKLIRT